MVSPNASGRWSSMIVCQYPLFWRPCPEAATEITRELRLWPNTKVENMSEPVSYPNNEETIVASISPDLLQGDTQRNRAAARGKVALVEGSAPHLSQETLALLRDAG